VLASMQQFVVLCWLSSDAVAMLSQQVSSISTSFINEK